MITTSHERPPQKGQNTMSNDPEAADTEGHVHFLLDEQGNPDVVRPDDEDTEGHRRAGA
jgi:hypothetical protein